MRLLLAIGIFALVTASCTPVHDYKVSEHWDPVQSVNWGDAERITTPWGSYRYRYQGTTIQVELTVPCNTIVTAVKRSSSGVWIILGEDPKGYLKGACPGDPVLLVVIKNQAAAPVHVLRN